MKLSELSKIIADLVIANEATPDMDVVIQIPYLDSDLTYDQGEFTIEIIGAYLYLIPTLESLD